MTDGHTPHGGVPADASPGEARTSSPAPARTACIGRHPLPASQTRFQDSDPDNTIIVRRSSWMNLNQNVFYVY
jgi:hypothetical protein